MRAMILAAGYGTRLWPLTIDRTKPAIPFLGKPLVGYVAEYLSHYGCSEVVVNLHHQPASVRAALGDGSRFGVHLEYVEEETILGTSGAIDNARHLLAGETFFVVNGKIITDINLQKALDTHRRMNALATLVLLPNRLRDRFSIVETCDGCVTGFGGMPTAPASDNVGVKFSTQNQEEGTLDNQGRASHLEENVPLMFTGIQILEPRIFDYIPRGVFSHSTTDVYPQAIAQGERIAAHLAEGSWYELSTLKRYLDISLAVLAKENRDVQVGTDCVIAESTQVSDSILWDGVTIERGASVRRVVCGDSVVIPAGERLEDAVVVRAELVRGSVPPAKALKGEFHGANFVVPLAQ